MSDNILKRQIRSAIMNLLREDSVPPPSEKKQSKKQDKKKEDKKQKKPGEIKIASGAVGRGAFKKSRC